MAKIYLQDKFQVPAHVRKWDIRFLKLAQFWANECSKDPSTKVGAVVVNDQRIPVGIGFNGFPRGVSDAPYRYENREIKYAMTVHAEENAILTAVQSVKGCTLYVAPLPPCSECAKTIIQAGITRVVSYEADEETVRRWGSSWETMRLLFREAGVTLDLLPSTKANNETRTKNAEDGSGGAEEAGRSLS